MKNLFVVLFLLMAFFASPVYSDDIGNYITMNGWEEYHDEAYHEFGYETGETISGITTTLIYTFNFKPEQKVDKLKLKATLVCKIRARKFSGTSSWRNTEKKSESTWVYIDEDGDAKKMVEITMYFDNEGHQIYDCKCRAITDVESFYANGEQKW